MRTLLGLVDHRRDCSCQASARDSGATATEYAILVSFVAVLIAVGVGFFGRTLSDFFEVLSVSLSRYF